MWQVLSTADNGCTPCTMFVKLWDACCQHEHYRWVAFHDTPQPRGTMVPRGELVCTYKYGAYTSVLLVQMLSWFWTDLSIGQRAMFSIVRS